MCLICAEAAAAGVASVPLLVRAWRWLRGRARCRRRGGLMLRDLLRLRDALAYFYREARALRPGDAGDPPAEWRKHEATVKEFIDR